MSYGAIAAGMQESGCYHSDDASAAADRGHLHLYCDLFFHLLDTARTDLKIGMRYPGGFAWPNLSNGLALFPRILRTVRG